MTAPPTDAFNREYQRLLELGVCDDVFGVEHTRVKNEWIAAGQPEDIEAFIRRRANIGPNGEEAAPRAKTKRYRCKHAVEALRWIDTDKNREAFATWFEKHDAVFETRGSIALLPDLITRADGDHNRVEPGEWILFSDGEFIAMEDELFTGDYEEIS